jgi:hypothetical protein
MQSLRNVGGALQRRIGSDRRQKSPRGSLWIERNMGRSSANLGYGLLFRVPRGSKNRGSFFQVPPNLLVFIIAKVRKRSEKKLAIQERLCPLRVRIIFVQAVMHVQCRILALTPNTTRKSEFSGNAASRLCLHKRPQYRIDSCLVAGSVFL